MDVTQLQRRLVDYTDSLFREGFLESFHKIAYSDTKLLNLCIRRKFLCHRRSRLSMSWPMQKITVEALSSLSSPTRNLLSQPRSTAERIAPSEPFSVKETSSTSFQKTEKQLHLKTSLPQSPTVARVEPQKSDQKPATPLKPTSVKVERPTQLPGISRPSSAPLMLGPRPSAPIVSMTQTTPLLARSSSASG